MSRKCRIVQLVECTSLCLFCHRFESDSCTTAKDFLEFFIVSIGISLKLWLPVVLPGAFLKSLVYVFQETQTYKEIPDRRNGSSDKVSHGR